MIKGFQHVLYVLQDSTLKITLVQLAQTPPTVNHVQVLHNALHVKLDFILILQIALLKILMVVYYIYLIKTNVIYVKKNSIKKILHLVKVAKILIA